MSLLHGGRSFISQIHLASKSDCSSNTPRSPQGPHRDRYSGPPPRRRHPPRLLPFPLVRGKGRSLKGSSPPSQPQVGGVLGRHWPAWKLCGADQWTVAVLQQGYCIPFHRLPLVSLVARELLSFALGSVRMQALDQLGLGFYSRLFLVEKVMGDWRPDIDLSTLNGFFTVTKFRMETVTSVLVSIHWGTRFSPLT